MVGAEAFISRWAVFEGVQNLHTFAHYKGQWHGMYLTIIKHEGARMI